MPGKLYHGISQVDVLMARYDEPDSPADHQQRPRRELAGMAAIARAANPDAEVETLGELIALGDQALREEIEQDTREE